MSDTDHKEEAELGIKTAWNEPSPEWYANRIAEAQVHATLYLAEQQRIANLIAKQAEMFAGLRDGESRSTETLMRWAAIERLVTEGLGL